MVTVQGNKTKRLRRRRGTRGSTSPYIIFGAKSTLCLAIFVIIYAIFMLCLQPTLKDEEKVEKFKKVKEKIIRKKEAFVGNVKSEGKAWKEEIKMVRGKNRGGIESELLDKAWEKFKKNKRGSRGDVNAGVEAVDSPKEEKYDIDNAANDVEEKQKETSDGFMVLGMHRSGTSMLSGLLVEGFGYTVGGPLIPPGFDNEKGFFELLPAVLQNDVWMYDQRINWAANVGKYDFEHALEATKKGDVETVRLTNALKVLNNPKNTPWLQKDPRMCITLKTWLPYLNTKPAILFTYRHPLEVAMSLHKREAGFTITRGLRLWMLYNIGAVQNSADLCRVYSSNTAVLANPMKEINRIVDELTSKCGLVPSPSKITKEIIDGFVDPELQHNKKELDAKQKNRKVLVKHGDCEVREFDSLLKITDVSNKEREMKMYLMAMKVYCDFESGEAYKSDYEWPEF